MQETLVKADARTVPYAAELGRSYVVFAIFNAQKRRFVAALESCEKGIKTLESVVARDKNNPMAREFLDKGRFVKKQLVQEIAGRSRSPRSSRNCFLLWTAN